MRIVLLFIVSILFLGTKCDSLDSLRRFRTNGGAIFPRVSFGKTTNASARMKQSKNKLTSISKHAGHESLANERQLVELSALNIFPSPKSRPSQAFDAIFSDFRSKPLTLQVLCGLNVLVFGITSLLSMSGYRDFFNSHFTSSLSNLKSYRFWTLLTSAFSHASVLHLTSNLVSLWMLGSPLLHALTPSYFVMLVLVSAIGSSLVSSGFQLAKLKASSFINRIWNSPVSSPSSLSSSRNPRMSTSAYKERVKVEQEQFSLGFSGVNAALMSAFALLYPYQPMRLMGIVSVDALDALLLLFSLDVCGLVAQNLNLLSWVPTSYSVNHIAHIAGYALGLAVMLLYPPSRASSQHYLKLLRNHGAYLWDHLDVIAHNLSRWIRSFR